jgi:hypothetical protein
MRGNGVGSPDHTLGEKLTPKGGSTFSPRPGRVAWQWDRVPPVVPQQVPLGEPRGSSCSWSHSEPGSRETVSGAGHEIQVDRPPAVIDALERILD